MTTFATALPDHTAYVIAGIVVLVGLVLAVVFALVFAGSRR